MPIDNKVNPKDNELTTKIKFLRLKFENISEQGIVFKINKEKKPTEIIGVLNFLKYKIERWNNTNIFSYSGNLFGGDTIIVIGANSLEDSINMMIYVFLTEFLQNKLQIYFYDSKLKNSEDLENYLIKEFFSSTKKGLPAYPNLEIEIKSHLEEILNNK
ncbi:MAG: hypothetical protein ACFE85_07125 [Candidatus Hodarchaeota archaeon]